MTRPIPDKEPASFAAGETAQWRRSYGDYPPADGYVLRFYFTGPASFVVDASDSGTDWLVTCAAVATKDLVAGLYRWRAYAEKGSGDALERYPVAHGTMTVTPNVTTATGASLLTHNERMLAAIRARLELRASVDMEQYGAEGRTVMRIPFDQLVRKERLYAERVRMDKRGGRLVGLEVRFARP